MKLLFRSLLVLPFLFSLATPPVEASTGENCRRALLYISFTASAVFFSYQLGYRDGSRRVLERQRAAGEQPITVNPLQAFRSARDTADQLRHVRGVARETRVRLALAQIAAITELLSGRYQSNKGLGENLRDSGFTEEESLAIEEGIFDGKHPWKIQMVMQEPNGNVRLVFVAPKDVDFKSKTNRPPPPLEDLRAAI